MASDFLKEKARQQAQKIDQQFGTDSYGGSEWLKRQELSRWRDTAGQRRDDDQTRQRQSGGGGADAASALPMPATQGRGQGAGAFPRPGSIQPIASGQALWDSLEQRLAQSPRSVLPSVTSFAPLPAARTSRDIQAELDSTDSVIQGLKQKRDELSGQAVRLTGQMSGTSNISGMGPNRQLYEQSQSLQNQARELEKQIAQLESDRAGLRQDWERAEENRFELQRQTPEVRSVVEKAMNAPFGKSVDSLNPTYRDVRSAMTYFQAKELGDERWAATMLQEADMAIDRMSESQRDRLAYYVGMGDYDSAADYLNRIAPALNQAQMANVEQGMAQWSQEHPVLGAATNIVSWPLNIPAYAANAKQAAKNLITGKDEQDPHMAAYGLTRIGTGTAQGTSEAARAAAVEAFGNETAGDVAAFLTSTGLSIGQNAGQIAVLGPASLAGMSMSAAGSATSDALERGATPKQAFLVGTAGGAIEAVTEKIPLDNLFRLAKEGGGKGLKATVIELFKEMGVEASEEMISEIANNLVDTAVMGDSSEFQMYVKELQASGLSKEEAEKQAFHQFYVVNVGLAGLGGAISGGVMSGGAMAAYELGPEGRAARADARTNAAIDQAYAAMQEKGLFSPEAGQAAKTAAERLDKVRKGTWDSIYLPTAEQGTVTLPGAESAVEAAQEAAEGQVGPQLSAASLTADGGPHPAAAEAASQTADGQAGRDVNQLLEGLRDTKRMIQEDYASGRITDEVFDAMMDHIHEQEGLLGIEMLEGLDGLGPAVYRTEGGNENVTGGFEQTAGRPGQQLSGGDGGRVPGAGAGGENGGLAGGGPRGSADTARAAVERQNTGRALGLEVVSSRELGVFSGTDTKNVSVLPESAWDSALRDTARRVRRETGLPVRFVLGGIETTGGGGAVMRVRGVYHEDGVIVQADHMRVDPTRIAEHEMFHHYAQQDPGLIQSVRESIVDRVGAENLDQVVETYIKKLRGLVDVSELGTGLEVDQAYSDILNEVFADAFAGINAFEAHAEQFQEDVVQTLEDRGAAQAGTGTENAAATDRRTGPPEAFSIDYDQDNRPFVTVEEDILDGVPKESWVKTVKDNLRKKFPNGVTVGNSEIKIDSQSRREMTWSRYSQWLRSSKPSIFADKMRATNYADEILTASRDYVNEGLNHPRKDDTKDLARGSVQLRVGGRDYSADVVVGTRTNGDMVLYDLLNLEETSINEKRRMPRATRTTEAATYGSRQGPSDVESQVRQTAIPSPESGSNTATDSKNNITQPGPDVKGGFFLPTAEQGEVELPRVVPDSGTMQERFSADDEDGLILPPSYAEVLAQRNHEDAGNVSNSGTMEQGEAVPKDKERGKKKTVKPVAESKPIIAKQELRQTMLSLFSIPAGMRSELGTEVDRLADRALKNGGLSQADRDAFFDRMYESGVMELEVEEHQRAGRSAVAGRSIYVPEGVKQEFGGSSEWNEFRKRAFAAGVMLTNQPGDANIDTLNAELSQSLPGIFKADETDNRFILEHIVQMAEEGQAEQVSLGEYTAMLAGENYVSEDEILDNLERQMDWALRMFTEKARLELKLRDRTGVKMAQQREAFAQRDEARRMREALRQAKEREQRREAAQRKREAKELREMQNRTLKQLQWIKQNQDRAPSELKEAFGEVLGDLDVYAVGAAKATRWNKKHGATWQDLAQMYKDAQENDPNFKPSEELERIVKRIDGAKVGDLDVNQLQDLYKAAVGLRTEFENRKQIIHDNLNRRVEEVFLDSKKELEDAPGSGKFKDGGLDKLMNLSQLSPMNVMQRMAGWNPDSAFYSMAKQLEQGERDIRAYTVEANRTLKDFLTEHEGWVKKSDGQGKDAVWYEIEVPALLEYGQGHKPIFGDTVKVYMTPAQKVHMYLESKGIDNLRHMEGGRTFPNKELYAAGKRQEAFAQGTTVKLAPETVRKLVSSMTAEELAMAQALESYYNEFARDRVNMVSNALYGYDKAVSKNYAPIYTNTNYNKSDLGVYDVTAEGVGRLKSRVVSFTPSYNLSAMDAFERHVEQTARFVGMSIPARNWSTLLNWTERRDGGLTSMMDVISHCWGEKGQNYIKDTIESLQSGGKGPQKDMVSAGMDKLFSNYISAVFGANPSIVFKQMGSIPMAGAWLEFKNFPSPVQIHRIDRELIAKYTQELDWRTMGYSMPETKQLKDNPNWSQTNKFTSFLFGGDAITAMDGWAASVLWPWAENKVRRDFPDLKPGTQAQIDSGTDPFFQKVAEEFNDAVARSQSTSDEMHQGTLRKSKNLGARTFTMFKSDSSQLYNALRQKAGEAAYYKRVGDGRNAKKARRKLGTVLLAAIGGYLWAEGVEFLINLWKRQGKRYRDDEGELTAQSVIGEMGRGLVGDLASVVTGGEELVDILGTIADSVQSGGLNTNSISAPGLEQLVDVIELIQKQGAGCCGVLLDAADVVKNKGDLMEYLRRHSGDIIGGIKETAAAGATYLPGLPVNNLEAYMLGTVRWLSPELAAAYEDALATANKNRLSGLGGEALTQRVETLFDVRGVDLGENGAQAVSALYEAGWKGAVPADTPKSVSVNSEDRELGAYQQQVYDRAWSQTIGNSIGELAESETFQAADEESREQMLKSLYSYAAEKAKAVLFEDYEPDCEDADAFLAAGASAAQWAAWQGQLGELSRAAKAEERSVKDAEKLALIQGQDWTDEVKVAAVGTVLGTKLETDSGNPTQYAKLLEAVKNGADVDTWLAAKGLTPEKGKDNVSDAQRWRAVVDAAKGETDQKAALIAVMSDSARMRFEIADNYGIGAEAWVQVKEALPQFDANGNGNYSGEEIENAIDALCGNGALLAPWDKDPLRLSREEKAVLWQLYTGSKSGSGNPYSTRVGKQVAAELEKVREEAKKENG